MHKIFVVVILVLVIMIVANPPDAKRLDFSTAKFEYKESNQMYFNNLRRYYYDHFDQGEQSLQELQFQKLNNMRFRYCFGHYPEQRLMFIYPKLDSAMVTQALTIQVFYTQKTDTTISLAGADMESQFRFAGALYQALSLEPESLMVTAGEYTEQLNTNWQKQHLTVLKDYFKLVGVIR